MIAMLTMEMEMAEVLLWPNAGCFFTELLKTLSPFSESENTQWEKNTHSRLIKCDLPLVFKVINEGAVILSRSKASLHLAFQYQSYSLCLRKNK